jgi:hypothetical protein
LANSFCKSDCDRLFAVCDSSFSICPDLKSIYYDQLRFVCATTDVGCRHFGAFGNALSLEISMFMVLIYLFVHLF